MKFCPRDGHLLHQTGEERLRAWACEACAGVWLPAAAYHARVGYVPMTGPGRESGMSCPEDGGGLKVVLHRGVELDVCAACGGIWFDRGELEKILLLTDTKRGSALSAQGDSKALDVALSVVDGVSLADAAGDVVSAVWEFLGGLAS
jgi:Zn-finger nucleic acid-binding protein